AGRRGATPRCRARGWRRASARVGSGSGRYGVCVRAFGPLIQWPPRHGTAAAELLIQEGRLLNRYLVVDSRQVDALALAHHAGDDVDDDGDDVGGQEVI